MDAETNQSQTTRAWRRCAACGRFFSFPGWSRTPRECAVCGSHALVPATPNLSFWRLLSD
jgi:ribosomal protein S14